MDINEAIEKIVEEAGNAFPTYDRSRWGEYIDGNYFEVTESESIRSWECAEIENIHLPRTYSSRGIVDMVTFSPSSDQRHYLGISRNSETDEPLLMWGYYDRDSGSYVFKPYDSHIQDIVNDALDSRLTDGDEVAY